MMITHFHKQYEDIMKLSEPQKTLRLSALMDDIQIHYNIPLIRDTEWEKNNRVIIALYRKVSMSRDI